MGRGLRRSAIPSVGTARHRLLVAATVFATLAACKEAARPAPVAAIAMVKAIDSVFVGGTRPVVASVTDAQGNFLTRPITWSSSIPSVATINAEGVVTGVAKGLTEITAVVEGKQASMNMNVQEPVATVSIGSTPAQLELGTILQLLVSLTDKDGTALSGRVVTFQTNNAAVATVSTGGVVLPIAEGNATVTATSEGKSASVAFTVVKARVATVTISPPGSQTIAISGTLQLSATLRDAQLNILTGRQVNWTSSNNFVASVSATGLVTGKTAGQVLITAESEGRIDVVGVQVVLPVPGSAGGASSSEASASGTGKR